MRTHPIFSVALAIILSMSALCGFAGAESREEPRFGDLIATTSETHLILFGEIQNAFSQEMTSGLKSGVPVDFSFFIELLQKKENEKDYMLARMQFGHTLAYDTLKDTYTVELEEFNNRVVAFKDLGEARQSMSEVNGVRIVELARLNPGSSYRIRIKAELFNKTLPLSLHRIMPFLSWWDRETDWQTLEFNF